MCLLMLAVSVRHLGLVALANSCLVFTLWDTMVKLLFWARVGLGLGLGTLGLASYGMYYIERWDSSPIDYIFRP